MSDEEEPRDPFRDEPPFGPWHDSLRQAEMVLGALAELPAITQAIIAIKRLSREDLECVVLERLYMWHAGAGVDVIDRWLYPRADPDS
jgi:hypothetical protein